MTRTKKSTTRELIRYAVSKHLNDLYQCAEVSERIRRDIDRAKREIKNESGLTRRHKPDGD